MEFTIQEVANLLNGQVEGEAKSKINTISKIQEAKEGSISFLANLKYEKFLYETHATAVIINKDLQIKKKVNAALIRVDDAYLAFTALLEEYQRDIRQGRTDVEQPENIDLNKPVNTWRSHCLEFFQQWIKYVYETTPF